MRKHCTMSELLAVRDGEGSAWARAHLEECPFCQQEMDMLYGRVAALRALPAHRPPRDRWAAIKAQADPTNLFHRNQNVPPAPVADERA